MLIHIFDQHVVQWTAEHVFVCYKNLVTGGTERPSKATTPPVSS